MKLRWVEEKLFFSPLQLPPISNPHWAMMWGKKNLHCVKKLLQQLAVFSLSNILDTFNYSVCLYMSYGLSKMVYATINCKVLYIITLMFL